MNRSLSLLVAGMLMSSTVGAVSFGSIPYDRTKLVDDLDAGYTLGLINPMNRTLNVTLSTTDTGELDVVSDTTVTVPPSETADQPAGSGWMVFEDGYVKPTTTTIEVALPRTASSQQHTFTVVPTIDGDVLEAGASSSVSFATEHALTFETTVPVTGEDENEEGPLFGADDPADVPSGADEQDDREQPDPTDAEPDDGQTTPITKTTLALVAAIILLGGYIWRQI